MAGNYLSDGLYGFETIHKHLNKDFKTEKAMCDFIEYNMDTFCADVLGVAYKSHKREYRLAASKVKATHSCRLDFLITDTNNQNHCIECKNPFSSYDNLAAIGQLLAYKELAAMMEIPVHRLVLVTSKIDILTTQVVKNNAIGIELIGIDKSKIITLQNRKYSETTA